MLAGSADRSIRLYNPQPNTTTNHHHHPSSSSHLSKKSAAAAAPPAVPEGHLVQTYAAHGYEVLSLRVAADNARFASAGGDRAVFLWDVASAQTLRRFGSSGSGVSAGGAQGGHTARVNAVCFAGDGDALVVSGGLDASVRVWDARSRAPRPVQVLAEARDAVSAVVARGPEIVAGSVDGCVRTYDVRAGRCVTDSLGPSVTSLCLAENGKAVLVSGLDSKLRLLDRETCEYRQTYADPGRKNESLRVQSILSREDQYVITGDEMTGKPGQNAEGRVWAWDFLTGELKATLRVPWGPTGLELKKIIGKDGKEKERTNVISCLAWREGGKEDQFCVSGTSGIVTVYGCS